MKVYYIKGMNGVSVRLKLEVMLLQILMMQRMVIAIAVKSELRLRQVYMECMAVCCSLD
ncbi:MAG: hypothetical protein ACI4EF_05610 [Coprococcus sp.]